MQKFIAGKRIIILSVGALLAALGLFLMRSLIFEAARLLLIAGGIALILSPICRLYEKAMPSAAAAALCLLTAILAVIFIFSAIIFPLSGSIVSLITQLQNAMIAIYETAEKFLQKYNLESYLNKLPAMAAEISPAKVVRKAFTGISSFAGTAADIVVAIVVAWYIMIDRKKLVLKLELFIPSSVRQAVLSGASEARIEIMMYLRGQAIIAACVGILSAAGLFAIGIPGGIPLGLTAGILNMIPYLGPVIACIPAGAIALTQGIVPCLLAIGTLIAVQQIDGLILSPRIVGNSTGFSPSAVMVAIFASGAVWGVAGMLLALPVMILIRTCVRVFVELAHNC